MAVRRHFAYYTVWLLCGQFTYWISRNLCTYTVCLQHPRTVWSVVTLAKSSAVYWFHYRSTRIHGWESLCVKNLRDCTRLEDDLLEIKYTNQCINNVRQTCARLLLFNTNVPLFVKNDFNIGNYSADNIPYPARNCVELIHWAGTVLFHRSGESQGKI